ncbi:MAG: UbiA family prenyltransferase [Candidatus Micrarchaeia archaeon]
MNFKNTKELIRLVRPEHSLMLVVAVLAAELMSRGLPSLLLLLLSLVTPVFVSMGAFAINDYYDIEVDKANKKDRPLVIGTITPKQALYVTALTMIIGVVASLPINLYAFLIAITFALLSLAYAYKLKELLFWGNAYVAFAMVIPFIYGDFVVSTSVNYNVAIISVMIFLAGLAREIHGTIRDYSGDTAVRNAHTLPKAIGIKGSALLALFLYLAAIGISAYIAVAVKPFALNAPYIVLVAVTDMLLIYTSIGYVFDNTEQFYGKARNISLLAMAIALIAVLAGAALPGFTF